MRTTIGQIKEMKQKGDRITMLTAYDYSTAKIVDEVGIPLILVGDSLGTVVLVTIRAVQGSFTCPFLCDPRRPAAVIAVELERPVWYGNIHGIPAGEAPIAVFRSVG